MGFFDGVSSFFGNVKDFFVQGVTDVWNKGKEIVGGVIDTGKNVVVTLHEDVVGYAKGVKEVAQGAINKGGDVIQHGEDTIGGIAKSFSWPLTIVAGGLGVYLLYCLPIV